MNFSECKFNAVSPTIFYQTLNFVEFTLIYLHRIDQLTINYSSGENHSMQYRKQNLFEESKNFSEAVVHWLTIFQSEVSSCSVLSYDFKTGPHCFCMRRSSGSSTSNKSALVCVLYMCVSLNMPEYSGLRNITFGAVDRHFGLSDVSAELHLLILNDVTPQWSKPQNLEFELKLPFNKY